MINSRSVTWNHEADVVVVGSGGAALTSAILAHDQGAKVLILEKSDQIGGTTAFSGGIPWIPMNRYMKEAGIEDSFEEAKTYVSHLTGGKEPDPALVDVFLNEGKEMINYLHENTPLRFAVPRGYGDYYADNEGGKREGRSLDPRPFSLKELGEEWEEKIRRNPIFPPLTLEEGGAADPSNIDFNIVAERMEKNITTMGRALIGALFKGVLDRGIEVLVETPGDELVVNDKKEVVGIKAKKDGEDYFIGARQGVVLAAGGFEWNKDLVNSFLKGRVTHPQSPSTNEGDGLIMAMEVGAALANMGEAWWSPAFVDPTVEYEGKVYNMIDQPRAGANSMIVNKLGKRFVNEGSTYMDLPKAFYEYDQTSQTYPNEPPVWLIFDQQYKDRTLLITMSPGEPAPDWVDQADTIEGLAEKIGVDPVQLKETVERFNEHAKNLEDPDFHKDKLFFGQMSTGFQGPAGNIGPIEKAPFYAIPIHYGTLGTNGGPRINEHGQVINVRGEAISGLYAAGNNAMGVLGPAYPGAGGTIGPAMTFGYLAGMHVGKADKKDI